MRVLPLVALVACYHYDPGSFQGMVGTHVVLPCLDVAVWVQRDDQVPGPVVNYAFGNRCDHDAMVDLGAARVVARDDKGRELHLAAADPNREIRPLAMPARLAGQERIAYDGDFAERVLDQVCVDVGAIDRSGPVAERWICSDLHGEPVR
jgi:hypothetical protein